MILFLPSLFVLASVLALQSASAQSMRATLVVEFDFGRAAQIADEESCGSEFGWSHSEELNVLNVEKLEHVEKSLNEDDDTPDQRTIVFDKSLFFDLTRIPARTKIAEATLTLANFGSLSDLFVSDDQNSIKPVPLVQPQIDQLVVVLHSVEQSEKKLEQHAKLNPRLSDSLILDVRSVVADWVAHPELNHGFSLHFVVREALRHHVSIRMAPKDLVEDEALSVIPLPTKSPAQRSIELEEERRNLRRAINARIDHAANANQPCQMRKMYVDFKELGYDQWILAPEGIDTNYCDGYCSFPLSEHYNTTTNAVFRTMLNVHRSESVPGPCCVLTELGAVSTIVHDEDGVIRKRDYRDMHVRACGCR